MYFIPSFFKSCYRYMQVVSTERWFNRDSKQDQEILKIAISQNRRKTLLRSCFHLLPVGFSFGILQLGFRQVYWRGDSTADGDQLNINEILAILQITAKIHEIMIVLSLSTFVLHHLRQQLSSSQGLPFGLFTSAYQVALGSHPLTLGFFFSWKSMLQRKHFQWHSIGLAFLMVFATVMGLAAGPSSAIVLIPRLDWWSFGDLFFVNDVYYSQLMNSSVSSTVYFPKQLFPRTVDNSSLPGPYCLESSLDVDSSCPFAGLNGLLTVLNYSMESLPVAISSLFSRKYCHETISFGDSALLAALTTTWTSNQALVNFLSLGYPGANYEPDVSGAPYKVGLKVQSGPPLNPHVMAICNAQPASVFQRKSSNGYDFELRDLWHETTLINASRTMFEWKELSPGSPGSPGSPVSPVSPDKSISGIVEKGANATITAIILRPADKQNVAKVTVCDVTASWSLNDVWFMSSEGPTVFTDFKTCDQPSGHRKFDYYSALPNDYPIRIRKEWADSLNAATDDPASTVLTNFIDEAFGNMSYSESGSSTEPVLLSQIISSAVADGLARIGSEFRVDSSRKGTVVACYHGWCSHYLLKESHDLDEDDALDTFPEPADIETKWTRVSFPVNRYGYGWKYNTVTAKVATAFLILHAIVILIHCCVLIYTGTTYSFASSIGELTALALNSKPPATLKATSAGISSRSTWTRSTAVREVRGNGYQPDRLEIAIDEGLHKCVEDDESPYQRPVAGKSYE